MHGCYVHNYNGWRCHQLIKYMVLVNHTEWSSRPIWSSHMMFELSWISTQLHEAWILAIHIINLDQTPIILFCSILSSGWPINRGTCLIPCFRYIIYISSFNLYQERKQRKKQQKTDSSFFSLLNSNKYMRCSGLFSFFWSRRVKKFSFLFVYSFIYLSVCFL